MKTRLPVVAGSLLLLSVGLATLSAQAASPNEEKWITPAPPYSEEPKGAGRYGVGTLRFRTDATGRVVEARMDPSTGSKPLDEATERFVRAHWRGPPNRRRSTVFDYRHRTGERVVDAYWEKVLYPIIEQAWLGYARTHRAEAPDGRVRLGFMVTPAGRVIDVRVLEGQAQPTLVALTKKALLACELPPTSPRVRTKLPEAWGGNIKADLRFKK